MKKTSGAVAEKIYQISQEILDFIDLKGKDKDDVFDEVQDWLLEKTQDLRIDPALSAKKFVKDNKKYKLAQNYAIKKIAQQILKQSTKFECPDCKYEMTADKDPSKDLVECPKCGEFMYEHTK
jgi:predicted RNA-binding Zn-ribbon protein involved in translation (DUF1610 family)